MSSNIIYVKSFNKSLDISDFFKELNKCQNITQDFLCTRLDEISIRDILRDYISKNGISSLFHFSITCDAVLHAGIHVDEIEEVMLGFIRKLKGTKNLLIIDPAREDARAAHRSMIGQSMRPSADGYSALGVQATRAQYRHDAARVCDMD